MIKPTKKEVKDFRRQSANIILQAVKDEKELLLDAYKGELSKEELKQLISDWQADIISRVSKVK